MAEEKRPPRAVGYVRVSTDDQADKGVSLEAQRARVTAYAKANGLELVAVVEGAGESAKSLDRPGLQQALSMLRSGAAEILIVAKLDRLTRSVHDWCHLLEDHFAGKDALRSASEHVDLSTASGRMPLGMMMFVAQWERESIAERTSTAMQHKASQGEYTGGAAPYGYKVVASAEGEAARVEPEPTEQAVIAKTRELRGAGLSLRAVAAALDSAGMRARTGKPFAAGQVARMLEP